MMALVAISQCVVPKPADALWCSLAANNNAQRPTPEHVCVEITNRFEETQEKPLHYFFALIPDLVRLE
jgi:hypothetical protein